MRYSYWAFLELAAASPSWWFWVIVRKAGLIYIENKLREAIGGGLLWGVVELEPLVGVSFSQDGGVNLGQMVRQVLLLTLLDEGRGGMGVGIGRTEDLVAVLAHFKYFKSNRA